MDSYQCMCNCFDIILLKDTKVSETTEFHQSYYRTSTNRDDFGYVESSLLCYKGSSPHPQWMDIAAGSYSTLCKVIDNGQLINTSRYVSNGGYYIMEYDVVLAFGLMELATQFAWEENVS
ncbi:hypothetical protein PISMIDRAFT_642107 [Pisolithus microcarpus 441]|uniref:Uncharacterized protein n=1 Tax=Pisolithus microcarpus 441 TaxID=765257 RepID=A0A0C9YK99_9AGAM|nr:hypothetical protein PISMIDRAFT_642107 [Pisolithus microcarpus 441]